MVFCTSLSHQITQIHFKRLHANIYIRLRYHIITCLYMCIKWVMLFPSLLEGHWTSHFCECIQKYEWLIYKLTDFRLCMIKPKTHNSISILTYIRIGWKRVIYHRWLQIYVLRVFSIRSVRSLDTRTYAIYTHSPPAMFFSTSISLANNSFLAKLVFRELLFTYQWI